MPAILGGRLLSQFDSQCNCRSVLGNMEVGKYYKSWYLGKFAGRQHEWGYGLVQWTPATSTPVGQTAEGLNGGILIAKCKNFV